MGGKHVFMQADDWDELTLQGQGGEGLTIFV